MFFIFWKNNQYILSPRQTLWELFYCVNLYFSLPSQHDPSIASCKWTVDGVNVFFFIINPCRISSVVQSISTLLMTSEISVFWVVASLTFQYYCHRECQKLFLSLPLLYSKSWICFSTFLFKKSNLYILSPCQTPW